MMKYTQKLALQFTLISFLVSGCTEHMPLDHSSTLAPPSLTSVQAPQDVIPAEHVQNLSEMQLVMLSEKRSES